MDLRKTKNKDFLKWVRAESCFTKDHLISSEWLEKLEKIPMFVPTYAKSRPEMAYIMSMEYGRMWHKEKDDWFAQIFKENPKDRDMTQRRRKLRMEFLEAKRQAEIKIRERKERIAKEAEAKAKVEAEAQEKAKRIKAKLERCSIKKKEKKKKPAKQETQNVKTDKKDATCPKNWTEVELTVQCECAANKDKEAQDKKKDETEQVKKLEEKEPAKEKKVEDAPCTPECIQDQIAEAVQRVQEGDVQECVNQDVTSSPR